MIDIDINNKIKKGNIFQITTTKTQTVVSVASVGFVGLVVVIWK